MTSRGSVAVSLLVLVLFAGPALAYTADTVPEQSGRSLAPTSAQEVGVGSQQLANTSINATNTSGPSFGGQISAFMQSNAVNANGSVENGMWSARVTASNGSDRVTSVTRRIAALERRQERLQSQLDRFGNERNNASDPAAAAQLARLTTRIQMHRATINETSSVAAEVGVNETNLERLRTNATNMTGHDVAALARNLSMGPPAGVPGGPPTHAGPPDDDKTGPPDDDKTGPPDDDKTGPPDDDKTGPP